MVFIHKNSTNRFDILFVEDKGFEKKGKHLSGIAGYHGCLANIIGWIMEKIFHKTISLQVKQVGSGIESGIYYFNCKSLANWLKRVEPNYYSDENIKINDQKWLKQALEDVCKRKLAIATLKETGKHVINKILPKSLEIPIWNELKTKDCGVITFENTQ